MYENQVPIVWLVLMGLTALAASWKGLKAGLFAAGLTSIYIFYQAFYLIDSFEYFSTYFSIIFTLIIGLLLGRKTNRCHTAIQAQEIRKIDLEKRIKVYNKLLNSVTANLTSNLREQAQAEAARQNSTDRYQTLATKLHSITTNAPICIYELDRQGRILSVNQNEPGITSHDITGTLIKDWFTAEQQPEIQSAIANVFSSKKVQLLEISLADAQGMIRFYRTKIIPIFIDNYSNKAILIATDITENKQIDAFLHRQALIFETIYDGIIVTDISGEIIDWNPGAERIFGYSKAEVLGQTPAIIYRPEEAGRITAEVLEEIHNNGRWFGEINFIRKNGTEGVCETIIVPMFDAENKLIATVGINHDITKRKQTEAALYRSREQWQLLLKGTNDGIWDHDFIETQYFLSKRGYQLLGYGYEEIQSFQDWLALTHPEDRERMNQTFQAHLNRQTPFYIAEYRVRCREGYYKWVLSRGQAVWDETGKAIRAVGSIADISDRKQAELELKQHQNQLEQLVAERTHELTQANEKLQREVEARSILAAALQASEARLAGILDNARDAIISVNENQQITLYNKGAERIFGYKAEDILNQPLDVLLPQTAVEVHHQHIRAFGVGGISSRDMKGRRDIYGRRHDGTIFPAEASVSQIRLDNQTIYTAILRDISDRVTAEEEREQAEIALRDSQRRYVTITQVAPVGIFHTDTEGNCSYVNECWCEIAGISPEEASGQGWVSAIHPADRQNVFQAWREAVQNRCLFKLEYRFQRPDGKITWVMGQAVAERDETDNVKGFVGSITDIHARKQAEAVMRESERRWRSLLENVRLSVVGLNCQAQVEYVNPFFLELTGYTHSEVVGQNWFEMFLRPAERSQVYQCFQQTLQQEPQNYYQNIIITKQGEEKIVAWNNTQLQSIEGEGIGTMSIGEDITERYAIERMKNEFISVVSHELRTPLTAIHGAIDLLSSGLIDAASERGKQVIKIAAESTDRLVRLVNDILELERLESGKMTLTKEWVDGIDLLLQAKNQMQVMANRAKITLAVIEQELEFIADTHRLLQVLINLISNAIKFSPSGSTVTISLELNPENLTKDTHDWIVFTVKDEGRGIPPDKMDSIFERFHQVDASDSRQKGGTGLGLAICRSIVEQHGGKIWVESRENEGSCFYFSIPAKLKEQANES
ncbi:MAG: PAS domain S-box protein [Microcoleaceae cyanobacterium]